MPKEDVLRAALSIMPRNKLAREVIVENIEVLKDRLQFKMRLNNNNLKSKFRWQLQIRKSVENLGALSMRSRSWRIKFRANLDMVWASLFLNNNMPPSNKID